MQEFYEKYHDAPRQETYSSIDKPMIIFLGLTLPDFIIGVSAFILIVMFWDSAVSIPIAILSAVIFCLLSKSYRKFFPPLFLSHFNWSFGLQKFKGIPNLFKRGRFKFFC